MKRFRKKVANRLTIVLHMNKSSIPIAFTPEAIKSDVQDCIRNNEDLLNIIQENVAELLDVMELCDKTLKIYKSGTFLMGNIIEGILYNLALNANVSPSDLERASIERLAKILRGKGIIDDRTKYLCRFIQHYRDFIHPARNLKHKFMLNHNFNKMFLFFMTLLLGDLQKSSENLALPQVELRPA